MRIVLCSAAITHPRISSGTFFRGSMVPRKAMYRRPSSPSEAATLARSASAGGRKVDVSTPCQATQIFAGST